VRELGSSSSSDDTSRVIALRHCYYFVFVARIFVTMIRESIRESIRDLAFLSAISLSLRGNIAKVYYALKSRESGRAGRLPDCKLEIEISPIEFDEIDPSSRSPKVAERRGQKQE